MKPCPTYELNNLYKKFPHLNPQKVANPLKPTPLQEIPALSSAYQFKASSSASQSKEAPALKNFFDKVNAIKAQDKNGRNRLKEMKGLSSSLMTMESVGRAPPGKSPGAASAYQMPGRSSSATSLVSFPRTNQQKNNRNSPQQNQGGTGKTNGRQQSNGFNGNNGRRGMMFFLIFFETYFILEFWG